mmetsp:Transcript_147503/g.268930  ORF Transcript_147503/g.268930 Transcript_147503/m.268930 type:complete len:254 (-) Transcript_147503:129-890(-)
MAARLVFLETGRELPSLHRGWRTPDPSPTRDAAGLPGWELKPCIENCQAEGASTPRGRSIERPMEWTSRTPSPSATRQQFPTEKVFDQAVEDQMPTPRMQPLPFSFSPPSEKGAVMLDTEIEIDAPPKPSEEARPQKASKSQKAKQKETSLAVRTVGESGKSKAPETGSECMPTVSIGSVGHPLTCAEPCKYVMKKNRGCKDGAACNRCHLCEWKKRGPRKTKEVKDAPSTSPDAPSAQPDAPSAQPEQSDQD